MSAKWFFLISLVLLPGLVANGALRTVYPEPMTSDTTVNNGGGVGWAGSVSSRVGGSSVDGWDTCVVYVFELPAVGENNDITDANLSFYFESYSYYRVSGNADLYGLPYSSSSAVQSGHWYQGPYAGDPSAAALQDNVLTPSSLPNSTISTDSSGNTALKDYLNAQYAGGAGEGDYIFIRVGPDANETNNPQRYWVVSMTESDPGQQPILTVTIGPIDTDPPVPDPMTWADEPYPTGDNSVSMTATIATDASEAQYYFAETSGNSGGSDSGWQDSTTYRDADLTPSTSYSYKVKARDKSNNHNETYWSSIESAFTDDPDTTLPTPDPMEWAVEPNAIGGTSISMTAETATDDSGVEYFFECTAGGGSDSGWQDSTTYTDIDLSPTTSYSYKVKARDKSTNLNETAYSTVKSATTTEGNYFYVDPVTGSMSNDGSAEFPWSTLEEVFADGLIESRYESGTIKNPGAPVKKGDTIVLRSGYHGDIVVSGYFNDAVITITAELGHTPELKRFRLSGGKNWLIQGLDISVSHAPVFERVTMVSLNSRSSTDGICSDIVVEDCNIYTIADSSGWSAVDWDTKACGGISLGMDGGANLIARDNHLLNINHGITLEADGCIAEDNIIENFSGDGIRAIYHNVEARYNLIKNCYNVNDNHDDGIQSFLVNAGYGTVSGIKLIGNIIINTSDPAQPHQGPMQGIGLFDGPFYDFVIENNVVMTDHYHGITLLNSQDGRIVNNTVFNKWYISGPSWYYTWILVTAGSTNGGNLVRNNICHKILTSFPESNPTESDPDAMVDHNLIFTLGNDPAVWFVDYSNFDMHLADTSSPPFDAGYSMMAPDTDIEGVSRPQGYAFDIGAYEYAIDTVIGDLTRDYVVGFEDVKVMSDDWLTGGCDFVLDGLVSRYKLDGDATDSINGNDGTEIGGPGYAPGVCDQAISLDGVDDYVNCGNDSSFEIIGPITLSVMLKGTFNSSWDPIISKGFDWQLSRGTGDEATFFCIGLGSFLFGSANINDNQWHHIVAMYDGAQMRLYVDGKLDASQTASGSLNVSGSNVYIGGSPSQSFNGLIDDVRIYDRVLSDHEIDVLYTGRADSDLVMDHNIDFKDFAVLAEHWPEDAR